MTFACLVARAELLAESGKRRILGLTGAPGSGKSRLATALADVLGAKAVEYLRHAAEMKEQNPYYLSFLGLSVARAQGKWSAAVELCETALSLRRNEAQLYLNLAEVYVAAGRRDDAVAVLDRGLLYIRVDARIKRARANLGRRCSPVLPFLERGHFLNRALGKLRYRVLGNSIKPGSQISAIQEAEADYSVVS